MNLKSIMYYVLHWNLFQRIKLLFINFSADVKSTDKSKIEPNKDSVSTNEMLHGNEDS